MSERRAAGDASAYAVVLARSGHHDGGPTIGEKMGNTFEFVNPRAWSEPPTHKAWQRYEGPRGGEGWENTTTGEVRYQKDKPEGEDTGPDGPAEGHETTRDESHTPEDTFERHVTNEVWNDIGVIQNYIQKTTGKDFSSLPKFYDWVEENNEYEAGVQVNRLLRTGKTPYPYITDEDVPDPKFNPNNYDVFGTARDMIGGDMVGMNQNVMFIADRRGGSRLFIKNLNPHVRTPRKSIDRAKSAFNALVASKLFGVMGETAPEHHLQPDEYLAVEEYDGDPKSSLFPDEYQDTEYEYVSHLAASAVVGNNDPHAKNVFYGEDGFATVDLDMSFQPTSPEEWVKEATYQLGRHLTGPITTSDMNHEEAKEFRMKWGRVLSREIKRKARSVKEWLETGQEEAGISPDDLANYQREMLEEFIDYVGTGEHGKIIRQEIA